MEWYKVKFIKSTKKDFSIKGATGEEHQLF